MSKARVRGAAPLAVATLLALAVAAPAGSASAADVAPALSPSVLGDRAANPLLPVLVDGRAPVGTITAARLISREDDGDQPSETVPPDRLNKADDRGEFLDVDEQGRLRGRLSLGCVFNACDPHDESRSVRLEVTVAPASGAAVTGVSVPLRVDGQRPLFRAPETVGTRAVRVRFTEPVRRSSDLPSDWRVTRYDGERAIDVPVESVHGASGDCAYRPGDDASAGPDGCTRLLRLRGDLPEDGRVDVEFVDTRPDGTRLPVRDSYTDFASNRIFVDDKRLQTALDLVRPALPDIEAVAGQSVSSDAAAGRGTAGSVTVGNVTPGHTVWAVVAGPDGQVTRGNDVVVPPGASRVTVPLGRDFTDQGAYRVEVVASDPAGNLSTETSTKNPPRADGRSVVTYNLDSRGPLLLSAITDNALLNVTWSEAVVPRGGQPADWKIRAGAQTVTVTAVSDDDGPTRQLTLAGEVPPGATLTHEPPADSPRYTDAVGNPAGRGPIEINGVPLPRVTSPVTRRVEAATVTTITGTVKPGTLVRVHRDVNDDSQPDPASVVGEQQLAAGAADFAVQVPLVADAENNFVVTASDTARSLTSRPADVAVVVQDSVAPVVSVTTPAEGSAHAGSGTAPLTYGVQDRNDIRTLTAELSVDGGATWLPRGTLPLADNRGTLREQAVPLTPVDTDRALLRVTAVDAAGRAASALSRQFIIDAVQPRFTARTGPDRRTVRVVFTELVTGDGTRLGTDWTVAGQPALSATSTDQTVDGRRVTVTDLRLGSDVGPNDRPAVTYRPLLPEPVGKHIRDRAGQPLLRSTEEATDGIAPAAPVVRDPAASRLTRDGAVRVAGTGEPGSLVEVRRGTTVLGRSATVPADGTWALTVPLASNADNDLTAVATDTGGNTSTAVAVPRITQDASGPTVAIDAPTTGTQLAPGSTTTIQWRTEDRNPADLPVTLLVSTDGGVRYTVIARDQAPSSSYLWTVPDVRTAKAVLRVDAVDRLGNTTQQTTGFLGIGEPADGGTPPPAVVEVTAVTVSANDRTITAGNAPLLAGTATDADGRPVEGEPVRVFQKVWGQTGYAALETPGPVRTDSEGRYALRVRPDRQRSYVVQVGNAKSRPLVIAVFNRVNVSRPVGGATIRGGATTVKGDLDPDFASVRVGVAVLRNGRFGYITQGVTDGTGAYSIPVRGLPRGDYALVVYTSARQGTGAGSASRAVRVS